MKHLVEIYNKDKTAIFDRYFIGSFNKSKQARSAMLYFRSKAWLPSVKEVPHHSELFREDGKIASYSYYSAIPKRVDNFREQIYCETL